jgi:hypothetical protein
MDERDLAENMQKMLLTMRRLDEKIAPMLEADGKFFNKRCFHFHVFFLQS